jgi:hypothetical protein
MHISLLSKAKKSFDDATEKLILFQRKNQDKSNNWIHVMVLLEEIVSHQNEHDCQKMLVKVERLKAVFPEYEASVQSGENVAEPLLSVRRRSRSRSTNRKSFIFF